MGTWDRLFEASGGDDIDIDMLDDDELEALTSPDRPDDKETKRPPRPGPDNPLLKPSTPKMTGGRPSSSSPSVGSIGPSTIAARQAAASGVKPGGVQRSPKSASGLRDRGIKPKDYWSDDAAAPDAQKPPPAGTKPGTRPSQVKPPGFAGTVPGQVHTRAGKVQSRGTSWTDKATGEKKFGKAASKPRQTDELVWDGKEWIPPALYAQRAWERQGKKKTESAGGSWEMAEANWDKLNKRKNMARWGTQDRNADPSQALLQRQMAAKRAGKPTTDAGMADRAAQSQAGAAAAKKPAWAAPIPPRPKAGAPAADNPLLKPSSASSTPGKAPVTTKPQTKLPDGTEVTQYYYDDEQLESVLAMEAEDLVECGCEAGVWGEALDGVDSDDDDNRG